MLFIPLFLLFILLLHDETLGERRVRRFLEWRVIPFLKGRRYRHEVQSYLAEIKPERDQRLRGAASVLIVLCIFLLLATKSIFFAAVVSGSMEPTFERGDLVMVQSVYKKVHEGDIIIFKSDIYAYPITHRAVEVSEKGIRTKGDANKYVDAWTLGEEDVIGKIVTIGGRPIIIKDWGIFFIVENRGEALPLFGSDYEKYQLFLKVLRTYGLVISIISLLIYISLTYKDVKTSKEE